MNITLNTSSQIAYNNNNLKSRYNQNFTSAVPVQSAFLKPFNTAMDKMTDGIAKYYTGFAFSNRLTNWLAKREKLDKIVGHMQTAGSFIISGMYMTQTLRNKDLDEKRKKTLAVNQGLTLLFSTLGAYILDDKLASFWNKNVSMKYAAKNIGVTREKLEQDLNNHRNKIKALYMEKHPEDANLTKFQRPNLLHYIEKGLKNETLTGKIKGLDALRSLVVFGTVYRFIGPVAVTPFANMIGNILFYSKTDTNNKNNEENKVPNNINITSTQYDGIKPVLNKFINTKA